MANILLLGVKVPFTSGGQEALVKSLRSELQKRDHQVDVVELPLQVLPKESLLDQCAMWRSLDLSSFGGQKVDLVIATKFPSYFAQHAKKSVWLVHQHRAIYDLYGTRYSDFSDDPRDEALRLKLTEGDKKVLSEADYIGCISKNVSERLKLFNGIASDTLYPPLPLGDKYYSAKSEPYILSVGRICSIKRVDLIIKSLPMIHQFVRLKIVGMPDEPGVMDYLNSEIEKHHLKDRVDFLGRVSDEELLSLYAHCLAVYYGPFNEDYGYVTLEAQCSSKPVITCTDSGGVLEFVKNDVDGVIAEPTLDGVSKAANKLIENSDFANSCGLNGRKSIESLGILTQGWDNVIKGLLSPII